MGFILRPLELCYLCMWGNMKETESVGTEGIQGGVIPAGSLLAVPGNTLLLLGRAEDIHNAPFP